MSGVEGRTEMMWESADKIETYAAGRAVVGEKKRIVDGRVAELVGGAENERTVVQSAHS